MQVVKRKETISSSVLQSFQLMKSKSFPFYHIVDDVISGYLSTCLQTTWSGSCMLSVLTTSLKQAKLMQSTNALFPQNFALLAFVFQ